jgi:hypothetical protein
MENQQPISEKIVVEYTKDKMFGIVFFEEPQNDGKKLTESEIRFEIERKGIKSGLDEELLKSIAKEREYGYKYVIAKGKAAIKGDNATIEYQFDIAGLGKAKPKQKEDGTVDFKELSTVHNVSKGQVLAIKTPLTDGEDGYNVLGAVIRAQRGKDLRMPKGKNTDLSEDGLRITAAIDGQLFYDGHNLYISPTFIVEKDVDSSVGNIDFVGNVIVNGNVNSGYTIKARGNVEVKGYVEAATIIAKGDVVLWYGIQGADKGEIKAGGNVITKFIQNSTVQARKDIVTEAILHSDVAADGKILVDKGKGIIVGGNVVAGSLISSNVIGSSMATVTNIQIGNSQESILNYKKLQEEYAKAKEELAEIEKAIIFLSAKAAKGELPQDKVELLAKLRNNRGIAYTKVQELAVTYKEIGDRIQGGNKGMIKVKDVMHSGVKVTIGNTVKYIKNDTTFCSIHKDAEGVAIGTY